MLSETLSLFSLVTSIHPSPHSGTVLTTMSSAEEKRKQEAAKKAAEKKNLEEAITKFGRQLYSLFGTDSGKPALKAITFEAQEKMIREMERKFAKAKALGMIEASTKLAPYMAATFQWNSFDADLKQFRHQQNIRILKALYSQKGSERDADKDRDRSRSRSRSRGRSNSMDGHILGDNHNKPRGRDKQPRKSRTKPPRPSKSMLQIADSNQYNNVCSPFFFYFFSLFLFTPGGAIALWYEEQLFFSMRQQQ